MTSARQFFPDALSGRLPDDSFSRKFLSAQNVRADIRFG
jgi:hypothetical protein